MSTTKDKIKQMFLSGQTLTSCGAAADFFTSDLRKIVSVLTKKEGLDIVGTWKKSTEGKRYKEYRLRTEDEKKQEVTPAATAAVPVIPPPPPVIVTPPALPEIKSTEPKIRNPHIQQQIPFGT